MQIYIMRHGQAELQARSDKLRRLTPEGQREAGLMGRWLASQISRLDLVLHSPYVRAVETWQVLRELLPEAVRVEQFDELVPGGDARAVADLLAGLEPELSHGNVLVVSHLPLVGYLVNELVPQEMSPMFPTGAVARVDYSQDSSTLLYLEEPRSLF